MDVREMHVGQRVEHIVAPALWVGTVKSLMANGHVVVAWETQGTEVIHPVWLRSKAVAS